MSIAFYVLPFQRELPIIKKEFLVLSRIFFTSTLVYGQIMIISGQHPHIFSKYIYMYLY